MFEFEMPVVSYENSADFNINTWSICISTFTEFQHGESGVLQSQSTLGPPLCMVLFPDLKNVRKRTPGPVHLKRNNFEHIITTFGVLKSDEENKTVDSLVSCDC
jgi:hypothetical protein